MTFAGSDAPVAGQNRVDARRGSHRNGEAMTDAFCDLRIPHLCKGRPSESRAQGYTDADDAWWAVGKKGT